MTTLQLGLDLAVEETPSVASKRTRSRRCFNWASTSRSRKRGGPDVLRAGGRVASIGPRPRGRGNPPGDPARQALIHCFNWASTSRSRKQFLRPTFGRLLGRLQLGLDLAVEETRRPSDRGGVGFPASIGPRPRGRGNRQNRSATWALLIRFNWASTSRSRKPPILRPGRRGPRLASIGPRPRGRGNPPSSGTSTACPSCFNWASTSRSRKHDQGGAALDSTVVLQLGLDLAVEETPPRLQE